MVRYKLPEYALGGKIMLAYGSDDTRLWKGDGEHMFALGARGDAGMNDDDKVATQVPGDPSSISDDISMANPQISQVSDDLADFGLVPFSEENASLGTALRTIYQQTVDENVPLDMIDLLNRLN